MDSLVLLEYNEKDGNWHFNSVKDGHPCDPPANNYEPVAYTTTNKAGLFCDMIDCRTCWKLDQGDKTPFTMDYIKREWKLFCYIFNSVVKSDDKFDERLLQLTEEVFDNTESLAKLGNKHFSDRKEDEHLPDAWDYNPKSFRDANI